MLLLLLRGKKWKSIPPGFRTIQVRSPIFSSFRLKMLVSCAKQVSRLHSPSNSIEEIFSLLLSYRKTKTLHYNNSIQFWGREVRAAQRQRRSLVKDGLNRKF
jgi:hypothetical protein